MKSVKTAIIPTLLGVCALLLGAPQAFADDGSCPAINGAFHIDNQTQTTLTISTSSPSDDQFCSLPDAINANDSAAPAYGTDNLRHNDTTGAGTLTFTSSDGDKCSVPVHTSWYVNDDAQWYPAVIMDPADNSGLTCAITNNNTVDQYGHLSGTQAPTITITE